MVKAFLIFIISIISISTYADHGLEGALGGSYSFNFANSSLTLAKNRWLFQYYSEYRLYSTFGHHQLYEISETDDRATEITGIWGNALRVNYGLTNRLTLSLQLPFAYLSERTLLPDSGQISYKPFRSFQFGDASILGNYMFMNHVKSGWQASVLGGLELPTGFQPGQETNIVSGSGSWDPMLGAVVAKRWQRVKLTANTIYKLTTPNHHNIDYGDYLYYQIVSTFALNKSKTQETSTTGAFCQDSCACAPGVHWLLSVGMTGEKQFEQTNHDGKFANTGFNRNYATIGITAATKNWAFSLGYDLVVAQKMNGFQNPMKGRVQGSIALFL